MEENKRKFGGDTRSRKRRHIGAFLASEGHLDVTSDSMVNCYYSRQFRICILAHSREEAAKWLRKRGGFIKNNFMISSVCRIADIDVNLTEIDLSGFGWQNRDVTKKLVTYVTW